MPSNFTFGPILPAGVGMPGVAQVNLIDFGASRNCALAGTAESEEDEECLPPSGGHPAFTSIRLSMSIESRKCDSSIRAGGMLIISVVAVPEKRDDLEALAYTLIYLAQGGLPWLARHKKSGCQPTSVKAQMSPEELCDGLPSVYAQFLRYSRELEAGVEPDYDFFINTFGTAGNVTKQANVV